MESRLDEERSQLSGAMKALHTTNSHQPAWEGGIHKDKVSPRTEHACYLAYACCLVLPVVERGGAQYQVNRGVLERQCFRHACKKCGVGSQAFCHLYHAIGRVYADQLRLRPTGMGSTQQFSCSTADIKDAHRLLDDPCCQGKRCLMRPIKKGSLQPGIFIGACPLIEALNVFFVMFCCHTCISFPTYPGGFFRRHRSSAAEGFSSSSQSTGPHPCPWYRQCCSPARFCHLPSPYPPGLQSSLPEPPRCANRCHPSAPPAVGLRTPWRLRYSVA